MNELNQQLLAMKEQYEQLDAEKRSDLKHDIQTIGKDLNNIYLKYCSL